MRSQSKGKAKATQREIERERERIKASVCMSVSKCVCVLSCICRSENSSRGQVAAGRLMKNVCKCSGLKFGHMHVTSVCSACVCVWGEKLLDLNLSSGESCGCPYLCLCVCVHMCVCVCLDECKINSRHVKYLNQFCNCVHCGQKGW